MNLLEIPVIARTRQNHAIEHATIHVLSGWDPSLRVVARSDPGGFTIYGDIQTEALHDAVETAIRRMRAGERGLAIHPNCGTNLVTAAVLTAVAALTASAGKGRRLVGDRIPSAIMGTMLAQFAAKPLGYYLQEHVTTSADVDGVRLKRIARRDGGRLTSHRVDLTTEAA